LLEKFEVDFSSEGKLTEGGSDVTLSYSKGVEATVSGNNSNGPIFCSRNVDVVVSDKSSDVFTTKLFSVPLHPQRKIITHNNKIKHLTILFIFHHSYPAIFEALS